MASSISVSSARSSLPKILAAVADGEEVTLTRHGRAVAVIVRPDSLRVRRADAAFDVAAQIHDLVREGRHALLPTEQGLTAARADELVAAVRADRSRA